MKKKLDIYTALTIIVFHSPPTQTGKQNENTVPYQPPDPQNG